MYNCIMSVSTEEAQTFQRKVLTAEKEKLSYYTEKTNKEVSQEKTENLFMNLSLRQILLNLSNAFINILNDLLEPGASKSPKDILNILTKEDRMIYLGLVLLFFAFSMYLIDITS